MEKKYNIAEAIIDTYEKLKRLNTNYKYKWTLEISELSFFKRNKRKRKTKKKNKQL